MEVDEPATGVLYWRGRAYPIDWVWSYDSQENAAVMTIVVGEGEEIA